MKYKLISFAIMVFFITINYSCKKPGMGGDNTIVAFPQHHGKTIWNLGNYRDTIYVKFNAVEQPGTDPSVYDRVFIGDSGENHVHIHGLQIGKYYLYGVGYDTSGHFRVSGGIPIELKDLTAETNINVPVTE